MEFYAIANVDMAPEAIREKITLAALPDYCESFALVDCLDKDSCEVESIWGRFLSLHQRAFLRGLRQRFPIGHPEKFRWKMHSWI